MTNDEDGPVTISRDHYNALLDDHRRLTALEHASPSDEKIRAALERDIKSEILAQVQLKPGDEKYLDGLVASILQITKNAENRRAREALSSAPEPIGGEAVARAVERARTQLTKAFPGIGEMRVTLAASDLETLLAIAHPPSTPEGEAVRVAIAALEPFAKEADDWPPSAKDTMGFQNDKAFLARFTLADCRAALTALTALRRAGEGV